MGGASNGSEGISYSISLNGRCYNLQSHLTGGAISLQALPPTYGGVAAGGHSVHPSTYFFDRWYIATCTYSHKNINSNVCTIVINYLIKNKAIVNTRSMEDVISKKYNIELFLRK